MSTAPAQPNFPRPPAPNGSGPGADHPARRARQVAAIAAAGTVAALTGFFAVRAAQADDTSGPTTAAAGNGADTSAGATDSPGGDTPASPWAGVDPDNGAGYDRGFDIDGDGDRPAPPDGGFGRGGQQGSGAAASPALPGDGSNSSSRGS